PLADALRAVLREVVEELRARARVLRDLRLQTARVLAVLRVVPGRGRCCDTAVGVVARMIERVRPARQRGERRVDEGREVPVMLVRGELARVGRLFAGVRAVRDGGRGARRGRPAMVATMRGA